MAPPVVLFVALVVFSTTPGLAQPVIQVGPSGNWVAALKNTSQHVPGTVIELFPGSYSAGGTRLTFQPRGGTAGQPIVVRGSDAQNRPVITQTTGQNIMDLQGSNWVLRDVEVTGGSAGLRFEGATDSVSLINVKISGTQDVALRMNQNGIVYSNILVKGCEMSDTSGTGEGMYLGCNNDACQFHSSIVEENFVHDLVGAGVTQGDGIEIKSGSHSNIIRNNVVYNVNFPCYITYDSYGRGDNIIENNVCWNSRQNGIQISAGAIVRNNIVVNSGVGNSANGIAVAQNQLQTGQNPRDYKIVHNTVSVASDACMRTNGGNLATNAVIKNNVFRCPASRVYAGATGTGQIVENNAVDSGGGDLFTGATDFNLGSDVNEFEGGVPSNVPPFNFYPASASALQNGNVAPDASDTGDYNSCRRGTPITVGAYEWSTATNPGGPITQAFKTQNQMSCGGSVSTTTTTTSSGSGGSTTTSGTSSSASTTTSGTGTSSGASTSTSGTSFTSTGAQTSSAAGLVSVAATGVFAVLLALVAAPKQ